MKEIKNMTVKEALIIDGYTVKEAQKQLKAGAWLYSPKEYKDILAENGMEEECDKIDAKINEILKKAKYDSSYDILDGVKLIINNGNFYILELCL